MEIETDELLDRFLVEDVDGDFGWKSMFVSFTGGRRQDDRDDGPADVDHPIEKLASFGNEGVG